MAYMVPGVNWGQEGTQTQPTSMSSLSPLAEALSAAGMVLNVTPGSTYSPANYSTPGATPPWVPPGLPQYRRDASGNRQNQWYLGMDLAGGSEDDRVYMGKQTSDGTPQPHIGIPGEEAPSDIAPEEQPKSITIQQAMNQPYTWDDDKVMDAMRKMRQAGFAEVQTFEDMMGVWQSMVFRASRMFTLSDGENLVTPWDVLTSMKKENVEAGVIDKDGNVVQTQVNKSVYEISDDDAWATLRSAMTQMLGRAPTDQEVRDFTSRANSMAQEDPTVTRTTTRTDPLSGESTSTTHTSGGYGEEEMSRDAIEEMEDSPEYGAYQAASTYFNALLSALDSVA